MGRKGKWFSSIRKALSPDSKEKKDQKPNSSKKKWFGKNAESRTLETEVVSSLSPPPVPEEEKTIDTTSEQNIHGYSVPVPVSATAEAGVSDHPPPPPVESTVEVVRVVKADKFAGKSREEAAAIQIQTAFRGYVARRALRALRGRVRLKSLMEGPTVKRQTVHTLRCMQTVGRVQSQVHLRRIRMAEENQALQRQLLQKHAQELEKFKMGDGWDDSLQSKEKIEANLLSKYEATVRRERALAYAFSHQQTLKNSSRSSIPIFMTSSNPSWGWSWLERWMAAHPWENRNLTMEKELNNNGKMASRSITGTGGDISKSYARFQLNSDKLSPVDSAKAKQNMSPRSPLTPAKPLPSSASARKLKNASPRSSFGGVDDDSRSIVSMQSERFRRHSIAGVPLRDDESLGSNSTVPSYMVHTESVRAKLRGQIPPGSAEKNGTPEKETGPTRPPKKRLSYPPSPAKPRRQPVPRKVEVNLD